MKVLILKKRTYQNVSREISARVATFNFIRYTFLAINLFSGTDNQFFYTAVSNGEAQTKQTKNKHKQTSSVQCLHLTINRTLPLSEINFCIRYFKGSSLSFEYRGVPT